MIKTCAHAISVTLLLMVAFLTVHISAMNQESDKPAPERAASLARASSDEVKPHNHGALSKFMLKAAVIAEKNKHTKVARVLANQSDGTQPTALYARARYTKDKKKQKQLMQEAALINPQRKSVAKEAAAIQEFEDKLASAQREWNNMNSALLNDNKQYADDSKRSHEGELAEARKYYTEIIRARLLERAEPAATIEEKIETEVTKEFLRLAYERYLDAAELFWKADKEMPTRRIADMGYYQAALEQCSEKYKKWLRAVDGSKPMGERNLLDERQLHKEALLLVHKAKIKWAKDIAYIVWKRLIAALDNESEVSPTLQSSYEHALSTMKDAFKEYEVLKTETGAHEALITHDVTSYSAQAASCEVSAVNSISSDIARAAACGLSADTSVSSDSAQAAACLLSVDNSVSCHSAHDSVHAASCEVVTAKGFSSDSERADACALLADNGASSDCSQAASYAASAEKEIISALGMEIMSGHDIQQSVSAEGIDEIIERKTLEQLAQWHLNALAEIWQQLEQLETLSGDKINRLISNVLKHKSTAENYHRRAIQLCKKNDDESLQAEAFHSKEEVMKAKCAQYKEHFRKLYEKALDNVHPVWSGIQFMKDHFGLDYEKAEQRYIAQLLIARTFYRQFAISEHLDATPEQIEQLVDAAFRELLLQHAREQYEWSVKEAHDQCMHQLKGAKENKGLAAAKIYYSNLLSCAQPTLSVEEHYVHVKKEFLLLEMQWQKELAALYAQMIKDLPELSSQDEAEQTNERAMMIATYSRKIEEHMNAARTFADVFLMLEGADCSPQKIDEFVTNYGRK